MANKSGQLFRPQAMGPVKAFDQIPDHFKDSHESDKTMSVSSELNV